MDVSSFQELVTILGHEVRQRHRRPPVLAAIRPAPCAPDAGRRLRRVLRDGDVVAMSDDQTLVALLVECPPPQATRAVRRIFRALGGGDAHAQRLAASLLVVPKDAPWVALERVLKPAGALELVGAQAHDPWIRADLAFRPLALFATADAALFATVHARFAARGVPLVAASTVGACRALLRRISAEVLLVDVALPPTGGFALWEEMLGRVRGTQAERTLLIDSTGKEPPQELADLVVALPRQLPVIDRMLQSAFPERFPALPHPPPWEEHRRRVDALASGAGDPFANEAIPQLEVLRLRLQPQ